MGTERAPGERANRIAQLNDAFRKHPTARGMLTVTNGVNSLGPEFVAAAVRMVQDFDTFNGDNDPHAEHDFGSFEIAGERCFWKIDYFDRDLRYGSEDPTDPTRTIRVLTIMLAAEY